MGEFLIEWLRALWMVLVESGPFLLVGFVIAGLLGVLVPAAWIARRLGGDDVKSVFSASILGVPVPLCSCSVIPTATQLRRSGASRGATTSFLISTPETGVDSIGATWALMDPLMTVVRPVAAFFTAFVAGISVNLFGGRGGETPPLDRPDGPAPDDATGCCDAPAVEGSSCDTEAEATSCCDSTPAAESESCCGTAPGDGCDDDKAAAPAADAGCCGPTPSPAAPAAACHAGPVAEADEESCCHTEPVGAAQAPVLTRAFRYAFGTLLDDLTPWFLIGFAISGLIVVALPDGFFEGALFSGWSSMLVMLVAGVPLYVCATASTPIAAAMMAKGLEPGAALVFLLAGPATNVATMLVVRDLLGKRALVLYLATIGVMSLLLGSIVNRLYPAFGFDPTAMDVTPGAMEHGPIATVSGIVLALLLVRSTWRQRLWTRFGRALRAAGRPLGLDPTSAPIRGLAALAVLWAWGSTAVTSVLPGQTVFVERFGRVVAERSAPGRIVHAPWPLANARRVSTSEVKSLEFGVDRTPIRDEVNDTATLRAENARLERLEDEAEMMTADETFVSIEYAVQYRVTDARTWLFGQSEPDTLVGLLAQEALRRGTAKRRTEELLVPTDDAFDVEVAEHLSASLERAGVGAELVAIEVLTVHAPRGVHRAFRMVASAQVDAETDRTVAEWKKNELLANARIDAAEQKAAAEAEAVLAAAEAHGAVARLVALDEAWRTAPAATRALLQLDAWRDSARRATDAARRVIAVFSPHVEVVPTMGATAPEIRQTQRPR